jgi:hypothetical protein
MEISNTLPGFYTQILVTQPNSSSVDVTGKQIRPSWFLEPKCLLPGVLAHPVGLLLAAQVPANIYPVQLRTV